MDLHRDVQSIREGAGIVGHDQDGVILRRLAYHLRERGYDPAGNLSVIPHAIEAEAVAAVAHEFELAQHHQVIKVIP